MDLNNLIKAVMKSGSLFVRERERAQLRGTENHLCVLEMKPGIIFTLYVCDKNVYFKL